MSIRTWLIVTLNLLLLSGVLFISFNFYSQFEKVLDERVMLQLTSIKRLKRIQIEQYIEESWQDFQTNYTKHPYQKDTSPIWDSLAGRATKSGIYDGTAFGSEKNPQLVMVKKEGERVFISNIDQDRIQMILLERTGMGETGETYLVGPDYRLRSKSRFFPEKLPYEIEANTVGVEKALQGINDHQIIKDYRGVSVYSAFHSLDLNLVHWAILSEIDVAEVAAPLDETKRKLFLIALAVIVLGMLFIFWLSGVFAAPLSKIKDQLLQMAAGNYNIDTEDSSNVKELDETLKALESLKTYLNRALGFSDQIGQMNLDQSYPGNVDQDLLGQSLLKMRDRLKDFKEKESREQIVRKRMLLEGEEKERGRLARELHDGIGPLLTAIRMNIQQLEIGDTDKLNLKKLLDDTINEVRAMSNALMPTSLMDFGLQQALNTFIKNLDQAVKETISFEDRSDLDWTTLDQDLLVSMYRICQELINNGLRHAAANKIALTIDRIDDGITIHYADDGHGFDKEQEHRGSGLRNIRERVEIFFGKMEIQSSHSGTEIKINIPLKYESG